MEKQDKKIVKPRLIKYTALLMLFLEILHFTSLLGIALFPNFPYFQSLLEKYNALVIYGVPWNIAYIFIDPLYIIAAIGFLNMKRWSLYLILALIFLSVINEVSFFIAQTSIHGYSFYLSIFAAVIGLKYRKLFS